MRFITITGASGVGKTTLLKAWSAAHPGVPCFRFDAVGVPTPKMMQEQYGSRENWQREMMFGWIKRMRSNPSPTPVRILEGQVDLDFIAQAYQREEIPDGRIICLFCDAEVMFDRLAKNRNQPELCTPEMLDWQTFLVRQARKRSGVILIDTSSADQDKNLDQLSRAISQAMAPASR